MARPTVLIALAGVVAAALPAAAAEPLRVCADPNNMPFSDKAGEGLENRLAAFVGEKLGRPVTYVWWAQRRGFVRNTLKAGLCDVVMGVPAGYELVETTRPYYRSTYVFVSRTKDALGLDRLSDPRLGRLQVGVQLVGDDGTNTPPAHALGEEGYVDNVRGYPLYGDYRTAAPPSRIVDAVADGEVDVAAVWGPLAGWFAARSSVPLTVTPIVDVRRFQPLVFQFDIAMGVKHGNHALRKALDGVIAENGPAIAAILADYHVPTVPLPAASLAAPSQGDDD